MKKILIIGLIVALVLSMAGCAGAGSAKMKVGMVTDAGTIDDKSFNQGTWEGIQLAAKDKGLEVKYLKPTGTTEADYLKEIGNLYDAGFKFIVCPGYKFETAVYKAQDKYADAKFVLIDGSPHPGDYKNVVKNNTVSIFFAEHESGFLVGVAAALQIKEGEFGYIGGMEIPAVQKFNWGFQQGVAYANKNLSTKITLKAENVIYQGSFDNVSAGQQLAAQMFDKGIKVIFCAAGGVGVGAINEAKARATAGKLNNWIIGVDSDQYTQGIYSGDKSIILTSALKRVDEAAYNMIAAQLDGKFPGGQTLNFNAANKGVSLPVKNPNLSAEVMTTMADIYKKVQSGDIKVASEQGALIK